MATSQPPDPARDSAAAKAPLRATVSAARARRSPAEREVVARGLAGQLRAAPEVRDASTVAAYVAIGDEPGTSWLLDGLRSIGVRVLLPVLLPDGDLDWATYAGPSALEPGRFGLLEPTGRRLGVHAVGTVDAVLVPGLAVSSTGMRLGRGGGSYDRALARVPGTAFTCVLLHDDETDLDVPVEPHDRPVDAAATPSGVRRFSRQA